MQRRFTCAVMSLALISLIVFSLPFGLSVFTEKCSLCNHRLFFIDKRLPALISDCFFGADRICPALIYHHCPIFASFLSKKLILIFFVQCTEATKKASHFNNDD